MTSEQPCFTVVQDDGAEVLSSQELRNALEKGSDEVKIDTLRRIIVATLNGNDQPAALMPIIQFVLPSKNKQLKKLLHFYWEVCRKKDDQGKLKQEMILVCNAIRNDLVGKDRLLLVWILRVEAYSNTQMSIFVAQPFDSSKKLRSQNFSNRLSQPAGHVWWASSDTAISYIHLHQKQEHRHSYVRKNAVLAILTIYQSFEHLIPDAPELIQTFITTESDTTCKRNAFVFLINVAPSKAVEYTLTVYDQIGSFDELMQLVIIELIRKDCKTESTHKASDFPKWIRLIFELLNVSSHVVKYDAAMTLTTLTQNPAAVKAAATAFAELVAKESDNNVKLIALDRIETLHSKHEHVLDGLAMDILGVLTSTDMEVRRKAVKIALSMVTSRNVQDVVLFLKKQLTKTLEQEYEKNVEYRQLLIQSIHVCAIRFSEVAASVVHAMMEFLSDSSNSAAVDVIAFVREVVEKFPNLRQSIVEKLLATIPEIKSGKVYRGALWIVGEYCSQPSDIEDAFVQIRKAIGEIPILAAEQRLLDAAGGDAQPEEPLIKTGGAPKVLEDGTYATETALSSAAAARLEAVKKASKPPLRGTLHSMITSSH
ncbi:coatomer subunit beta [Serendipita sp. 399]|nr:coatomer subunit beta [Serendipita sp. 399]